MGKCVRTTLLRVALFQKLLLISLSLIARYIRKYFEKVDILALA